MSRVRERCREIQALIMREPTREARAVKFAEFAGELDRMEEWLRSVGKWREENGGSACPWFEHCRCTHQGCSGGWVDTDVPGRTVKGHESLLVALRCPQCDRARLLVAQSLKASRRSK